MARGKLTQNEKYIIEGMLKDKHAPEEIAKELGRTKKTVENYRSEIKRKATKQKIKKARKAKEAETQPLKAKDLMVNKTLAKKETGVSVMTEAASARGDGNQELTPSRMSQGAIYKIDGSDE
tara:strand:- start:260 stop:625 length:366 start_codon:yes stop_codon:yes gene_type:complete